MSQKRKIFGRQKVFFGVSAPSGGPAVLAAVVVGDLVHLVTVVVMEAAVVMEVVHWHHWHLYHFTVGETEKIKKFN